jgi:excisionase family DNA binding protein
VNVTLTLADEYIDAIATRAAEIVLARIDAAADRGDAPEYLSVKDAAAYLGCTEGRVRKLVEARRIPFAQDGPGCRIFLSRADLDRFMQSNRNERRAHVR